MIDALQDRPGRAGARPVTAWAAGALIERLDCHAVIGLALKRSNGAPLSTASTSLRQSSRVAGGNRRPARGFRLVMVPNCHAGAAGQYVGDPSGKACNWRAGPSRAEGRARHDPEKRTGLPNDMLNRRRQLLDAGRCRARQRIRNADAADDTVRRDLGERHQHKGALEQARVRQCQFGVSSATSS